MAKTATIQARIEPQLKHNVERILSALGMSTTEAISVYFKQIELSSGLPFPVEIPNAVTRKAIADGNAGKGKSFKTVEALLADLKK